MRGEGEDVQKGGLIEHARCVRGTAAGTAPSPSGCGNGWYTAMNQIRMRLKFALAGFVAVMALGTLGFKALEGGTLADAFYFSIVTVATVGYGDIHPVTTAGKILVLLIIVLGAGTFLGVVANTTELMLSRREQDQRMEKLNLVIGAFFSEVGLKLLAAFSACDPDIDHIRTNLIVKGSWNDKEFRRVEAALTDYDCQVLPDTLNLEALRDVLGGKRDFFLRLLENPAILEHERFTELLRAVFHITEELDCRGDVTCLPDSDVAHITSDIRRAYRLLVYQWLEYMRYLKGNYPYLFSLAMRTNPFDRDASPVVTSAADRPDVGRHE